MPPWPNDPGPSSGAPSWCRWKPWPKRDGNTEVASGPKLNSVRRRSTVSLFERRTPSTSPTVAAYMRASERALVMQVAAGHDAAHRRGSFQIIDPSSGSRRR